VPAASTRRADVASVEHLGDRTVAGDPSSLDLPDHRQHAGGKGISFGGLSRSARCCGCRHVTGVAQPCPSGPLARKRCSGGLNIEPNDLYAYWQAAGNRATYGRTRAVNTSANRVTLDRPAIHTFPAGSGFRVAVVSASPRTSE
jgi:hypothetical protein